MLPSPSQQLFHPNSFTVTPQTFPSFPPTTMCTSTQTLTSPFPPQLLPHYDSSSPSGTVPTGVQAWDAGERWAPGGCNSPQPPPPTPQNVPPCPPGGAGVGLGRVVPQQRHLLPEAAAEARFDLRPCSAPLPAAQRIVATSRGLANFLYRRPPFLSGGQYSARSADGGPRCTPSMDAPAPRLGSRLLCCTHLHVHG